MFRETSRRCGPRWKRFTEPAVARGLGCLQRQTTIEPVSGDLGLLRVVRWPYPFVIGLAHKYLALQSLAFIRTAMTASRRLKGTGSSSGSYAYEGRRVHGGLIIWPPLRDLFGSRRVITSFRMQRRDGVSAPLDVCFLCMLSVRMTFCCRASSQQCMISACTSYVLQKQLISPHRLA